jgi:hypothetical protein
MASDVDAMAKSVTLPAWRPRGKMVVKRILKRLE